MNFTLNTDRGRSVEHIESKHINLASYLCIYIYVDLEKILVRSDHFWTDSSLTSSKHADLSLSFKGM
jgi:hypothetical protein